MERSRSGAIDGEVQVRSYRYSYEAIDGEVPIRSYRWRDPGQEL